MTNASFARVNRQSPCPPVNRYAKQRCRSSGVFRTKINCRTPHPEIVRQLRNFTMKVYLPGKSKSTNKSVGRRPDGDQRQVTTVVCLVCDARDKAAQRCRRLRGAFCQLRRGTR
jgi:hypothetical protein